MNRNNQLTRCMLGVVAVLFVHGLMANSSWAAGEIYKTVDKNGNVVYTDQPQEGAEKVKLKPLPTVPSFPTNTTGSNSTNDVSRSLEENIQKPFQYDRIDVFLPEAENGNAIRTNSGDFTVIANLAPRLVPRHRMQLLVDGVIEGSPRAANVFNLKNIDRGTHQLQIEVLDGDGRIIQRSAMKSISVQRTSVNQRARGGS